MICVVSGYRARSKIKQLMREEKLESMGARVTCFCGVW